MTALSLVKPLKEASVHHLRHRKRWMPELWYKHRGFAIVLFGLVNAHLFGALDELLPESSTRHSAAIFHLHNELAPQMFGWVHVTMAALIVLGAYRYGNNLRLVRVGAALSITAFGTLGISFTWAVVDEWPQASLYAIGFCILAVCCSVAALLEPSINPISARRSLTRRKG